MTEDHRQAVHRTAQEGYAIAAEDYTQGRPGYPTELLNWLGERLKLTPSKVVLDLGAGSGKFTPLLLATGAEVIAIEPVAAMLAQLKADHPSVQSLIGHATAIALPDASVDAVVCAQSFHWFATAPALSEIARILKPGGRLGLVWNMRDARVPWVARIDAIVNRYEGAAPRFYSGAWKSVFPAEGFGPLHETLLTQEHRGSAKDVIVRRVKSTSFIAALPPAQVAQIEQERWDLIDAEAALDKQAEVSVPYQTAAYDAQRH